MADPDLEILRGLRWRGGHPDPEIRRGGGGDFGLKISRKRAPPLDPPLGIGKRREVPSTILEKLSLIFLTLPNLL